MKKKKLLTKTSRLTVTREAKDEDGKVYGDEAYQDEELTFYEEPSIFHAGKQVLIPGSDIDINRYANVKISVGLTRPCKVEDEDRTINSVIEKVNKVLIEESSSAKEIYEEIIRRAK